jgi:hypothetical protein
MTESNLTLQRQARSCVALANAGELVSGIIFEVAGNDISTSLNGSRITADIVQTLTHQRILKRLEEKADKQQ